jgi:hypothetical protein
MEQVLEGSLESGFTMMSQRTIAIALDVQEFRLRGGMGGNPRLNLSAFVLVGVVEIALSVLRRKECPKDCAKPVRPRKRVKTAMDLIVAKEKSRTLR